MPCAARPCVGHRSLFDFRGKVVLRACAKWRSMVTISIIVFELCMRCFCLCVAPPQWGTADAEIKSLSALLSFSCVCGVCVLSPQWGTADAEIKSLYVEGNPELKGSPFKAWRRSVQSHACYACCQGFLTGSFSTLLVHSPAFFSKKNLLSFSRVGCG